MTNKVMKIVGSTALSLSLIIGASSIVSANNGMVSQQGDNAIEISPMAIGNTLSWDLSNNTQTDPVNYFNVDIGYPNIKLYAKNTGAKSFRVEVKHVGKDRVIFDKTIPADGLPHEFINNDSNPLVPSGQYKVSIYGGQGTPKGEVVLKSSDTPWP